MSSARAIVVSGASTGIGAATATLLAGEGFVVFAGVRNEDDAQRLSALSANVRAIRLDVTQADSLASAAESIRESGIALHGIVSNAGIALGGPLEHLPIDELRRQFEVNVFGALATAQTFIPLLAEDRARIVFVGSISGRLAAPYIGPYSASKFALRALADAMRLELAPAGISVSLIEPGPVKTPIWGKGRASAADIGARLGTNVRPHYRAALDYIVAMTLNESRDGMPVEVVSSTILHALVAPHPRAYYLLGTRARIGSIIAALPAPLRDRAVRASMRIP
ncbi:MAG TPA: SDR family NAD(P)-dependent oxidoreductase [Candidatus Baltobacteraceae bacterium]|nr:SDR family NAD(P)-dependent oxidoreductase [Candidatus Baltobacteraceae bacterium]